MFKEPPNKKFKSPLEKGDHPELDTSELLGPEGVTQHPSIVGQVQWAVSLGRIDVTTAVATLSIFRAAPRQGHLDRAKRAVGHLASVSDGVLRFRTGLPDYSDLKNPIFDWERSVCGDVNEATPDDHGC